jgi:hypothetical protein
VVIPPLIWVAAVAVRRHQEDRSSIVSDSSRIMRDLAASRRMLAGTIASCAIRYPALVWAPVDE